MSLISLLIFNHKNSTLYFEHCSKSNKNQLQQDKNIITNKAKALRSRVGQRDKLISQYGVWYVTKTNDQLMFAVCVNGDYPQRIAFGLVDKIDKNIYQSSASSIQKKINQNKKNINNLCQQYKDGSVDKLRSAINQADGLKSDLHKTMKKIIDNGEKLDVINEKGKSLKNYAMNFEKTAVQNEKVLFWNKWRKIMIIGAVLILAFGALGFIFYMGAH